MSAVVISQVDCTMLPFTGKIAMSIIIPSVWLATSDKCSQSTMLPVIPTGFELQEFHVLKSTTFGAASAH